MKKKKLLHLQLLPLLSGVQNFSLHLLDGIPQNEFEIYVASKPGGDFVQAIKSKGYHYIPLPTFVHPISFLDLLTFFHLLWVFRKYRFDIVHTHASKPGLLGRAAAWICKVPLTIHTYHVTAFQDYQTPIVKSVFMFLDWLGASFGDVGVFVNNSARDYCIKHRIVRKENTYTVYNAIPDGVRERLDAIAQQRFKYNSVGDLYSEVTETYQNSSLTSNKVGIIGKTKPFITFGSTFRFSAQKNVLQIVESACKVCKKIPNIKFIFVGDGDDYERCRAIVNHQQLITRVILPGWDNDILPYLREFDVFIMFSNWEAQPFSVIEAMQSGLPVLISDIPALRELVEESCGFIVEKGNATQFQKTIAYISQNPDILAPLGFTAHKRINELCSYNTMLSSYLELYRTGSVTSTAQGKNSFQPPTIHDSSGREAGAESSDETLNIIKQALT